MKQNNHFSFFLWLVVAFATASCVLLFNNELYGSITKEDGLVEFLGFFFLLFAGGYLIAASFTRFIEKKRGVLGGIILLVLGLVFFLTAFEEISWGQRIFGFETPSDIVQINNQSEFNFHNIDKNFFDRLVDHLTILFVMFSTAMIFIKKPFVLGIKLPDTYITLSFALIPFYHQYSQIHIDFYYVLYIPIALLIYRSFFKFNHKMFAAGLLTILITLLIFWLHTKYNHLFPAHNNSANEIRETLFALVCAFYAFTIYDDVRKDTFAYGFIDSSEY